MSPTDFQPDRKLKMAARGCFAYKIFFDLKSILGHFGQIFFHPPKNVDIKINFSCNKQFLTQSEIQEIHRLYY